MNGGGYMDIVYHICKSWLFKYWAKQHRLLDVRGIGVPLNVYIPKEGIDWNIKGLMILYMFITISG